jgi:hypothetical protein
MLSNQSFGPLVSLNDRMKTEFVKHKLFLIEESFKIPGTSGYRRGISSVAASELHAIHHKRGVWDN